MRIVKIMKIDRFEKAGKTGKTRPRATGVGVSLALGVALALVLGAAPVALAQTGQGGQEKAVGQNTSADSIYRAARAALNRSELEEAVSLFRRLYTEHPTYSLAPDALYWEAFARYRLGGMEQLREALARLEEQQAKYPNAATYVDARALLIRLQGQLARLGDPEAVAAVRLQAEAAAREGERTRVVTLNPSSGVYAVDSGTGSRIILDVNRQTAAIGRELASVQRELSQINREATNPRRLSLSGSLGRSGAIPDGCSREDIEIRTAALSGLLQADSARAVSVLQQVLTRRDPCSTPLRRTAVLLLAHRITPETEAVLLETARLDPDIHVRKNAVMHLSQVGTERAVEVLEEILASPADTALHEQALYALSQYGDQRSMRTLRSYAARNDAPSRPRGMAIHWVGEDRSPETRAFLQNLYRELEDQQIRSRILFSLAQRPDSTTTRWLMGVALDTTEELQMRTLALHQAGTRSETRVDELTGLYDRIPDQKLKEQLLFILTQREEPAAMEKLIEIARREQDPNLRKTAIYWLSQSRDPRAADVLLEIVGGT